MTKEIFITVLKRDIDIFCGDMMMKNGNSFLSYQEFKTLTAKLSVAVEKYCGVVVPEIEAASEMAKAVIAPDLKTKSLHLKKTIALASGVSGITLVIAGVGSALGWGYGIITTVTAGITGINMVPIFGQVAAGLIIATIAAYFIFNNETQEEITHKAIEALKQGISKSGDVIWEKYGTHIEKYFADQNK